MNKTLLATTAQLFFAASAMAQTAPTTYNTMEYVDINQIKATTLVHGDMWWNPINSNPGCEYPKGSGKHLQHSSALWVGGYAGGVLKVSAQNYRQDGNDFWPGPLDNATAMATAATSKKWAKIWKVNRTTIDSFKALSTHTIANTATVILQWPAKGNANAKGDSNAVLTITEDMAPFKDVNSDGIYNALDGDYPDIKGDQYLWWVFNDNGVVHSVTGGSGFGLQFNASAYAYNLPGDLSRIIYYEYAIKNKSAVAYDSLAVGLRSDADLGFAFDDYLGFDSTHRMGIVYNGVSIDGAGQLNSYGASIPISGVSMIVLPGDTGNVKKPVGSFMYYNNDNTNVGNPTTIAQYYGYLTASLRDGTHLKNNLGVNTQYVFPGDPSVSTQWSECVNGNTAGDRRFIISSNTFKLAAGATNKIAMALVVTLPDTNGGCPKAGFGTIKNLADSAWIYYSNPPTATTGIGQLAGISKLSLYPNPAETVLYIEKPLTTGTETVQVYDALGRYIPVDINAKNNLLSLDIKNLPNGVYTVQYRNGMVTAAGVFVKK